MIDNLGCDERWHEGQNIQSSIFFSAAPEETTTTSTTTTTKSRILMPTSRPDVLHQTRQVEEPKSSEGNVGQIAGMVVGIIIVLLIIACLVSNPFYLLMTILFHKVQMRTSSPGHGQAITPCNILWDVITYWCPRYLLLSLKQSNTNIAFRISCKSYISRMSNMSQILKILSLFFWVKSNNGSVLCHDIAYHQFPVLVLTRLMFVFCRLHSSSTALTQSVIQRVWTLTIQYIEKQLKTSSVWRRININQLEVYHRWVN